MSHEFEFENKYSEIAFDFIERGVLVALCKLRNL